MCQGAVILAGIGIVITHARGRQLARSKYKEDKSSCSCLLWNPLARKLVIREVGEQVLSSPVLPHPVEPSVLAVVVSRLAGLSKPQRNRLRGNLH